MNNFFVRIEQFVCAMYIKLLKEPKQVVYTGNDSTFSLIKDLKKAKIKKIFVATDKNITGLNLTYNLLNTLKVNNFEYLILLTSSNRLST